ncbi:MAG: DnaD domain protein [Chloroflexota bacterium]|nr:DnaD domain protein [Chloroflexota bacterium]
MEGFAGFPAGKQTIVRVPDVFFTELLPVIDDLAELKVSLHCLWLLNHKRGDLRYTRLDELAADQRFMSGLEDLPEDAMTTLKRGLEMAEARGTLLRVKVTPPTGDVEDWYFLNSERGRSAVERIRRGELHTFAEPLPDDISLQTQRPHIFVLYEQNIGVIQPMLADELREAERTYPRNWIDEAFGEAVALNKRSWRYIQRILERWAAEGKDDGIDRRDAQGNDSYESLKRRYVPEGYEDIVEH